MDALFTISSSMLANELPQSECIVEGPICESQSDLSDTLILLAHGAGANMNHAFMTEMASGLAGKGMNVVRFNFPYMRNNAIDGKRRPPDRAPKLLMDFILHIEAVRQHFKPVRLILMGKSMGGRMAAMVASEALVDGVICLGYPFVPPKGGEPRFEPIANSKAPLLVIQGERDKFGAKGEVETWLAPYSAQLAWLTDGDHSFVPRKSSGTTQAANLEQAISHSVSFIRGLNA
ncbi:alpha/beta fold hydrolase [Shewanella psychrotolerans]|uniref:alpha/beta fold hydrolase n=1 Tax=Shewanella psychrotolerans TaxID=2864206 RepID=UPI003D9C84E8